MRRQVEYGEAVGNVAAESIGEPGTQLILNRKWLVGAGELLLTQGLPRLIEIFDAKRKPSTPSMIIYFKGERARSMEKVKEFAKRIVEVKVKDVISEYKIDVARLRLKLILSNKKIREFGLKRAKVLEIMKSIFKRHKCRIEGNEISVSIKGEPKDLYRFKDKILKIRIGGVEGISKAFPIRIGNEWALQTVGSNLKEILSMEGVDVTRTTTNDIHEIERVLGIEAARNAIIEEVMKVLREQGIAVDVRHIMLVADMMCADGKVKGVGRYGVTGEKAGALARAYFEIPLRQLTKAALHGEYDGLTNVVEEVMINQPSKIGTGMVKLVWKRWR